MANNSKVITSYDDLTYNGGGRSHDERMLELLTEIRDHLRDLKMHFAHFAEDRRSTGGQSHIQFGKATRHFKFGDPVCWHDDTSFAPPTISPAGICTQSTHFSPCQERRHTTDGQAWRCDNLMGHPGPHDYRIPDAHSS